MIAAPFAYARVRTASSGFRLASRLQFQSLHRNARRTGISSILVRSCLARSPHVGAAEAVRDDAMKRGAARRAACKKIFHR